MKKKKKDFTYYRTIQGYLNCLGDECEDVFNAGYPYNKDNKSLDKSAKNAIERFELALDTYKRLKKFRKQYKK